MSQTIKIIEEDEDINIQDIEELHKIIDYEDLNVYEIVDKNRKKINELVQAVKYLEKTKEDK